MGMGCPETEFFTNFSAPSLSANRRKATRGQSVEPARYHAPSQVSELRNEQLVPGRDGAIP
jgi:hypothetical protein